MYGVSSAKKSGVVDRIVKALEDKHIVVHQFPGVRANPTVEAVAAAIDVCRANDIGAVLPLGGGSVFDSAKAVAAGAMFPRDVPATAIWECFEGTRPVEAALPIYGVLTISATGSEMNCGCVVQDDA